MDYENKLRSFEESCLNLASEKTMELKKDIENEIENQMRTELENYKQRKEWSYNKTIEKLEKNYRKDILMLQLDCKKEILNVKKEILKDLKLEVIKKIKEFTNSDEYKDFLLKQINNALKYTNFEENLKLGLIKNDLERYREDILKIGNFEVIEIEDIYLGGCTIQTDTIFIDNSLKNSIEEIMVD